MSIKNAKFHLAKARGDIKTAIAWLEQEEFSILEQEISKKKEKDEPDYIYDGCYTYRGRIGAVKLREIIREEIEVFMKKWVQDHIYDIK